jgi:hypothetical protein
MASTLIFASQRLIIYTGIPSLILGVLGGVLNIIIFLSLRTFRENSCAFYLTVMSFVNVGQLITGLLARVAITMTGVDWALTSLFYCKFKWYFIHICALTSCTCICLATIDQFLATCSKPQWRIYNNIKLSRYLSILFIFIWMLYEIPSLVFYNHVITSTTGKITCSITNSVYQEYAVYGYILTLTGILPIFITILFGLLAYRNVRQIPYRTVPLVRRELDKQLTVMVLVQVIFNCCDIAPFTTVAIYMHSAGTSNDPVITAQLQLISAVATCLYYSYFAVNRNEMKLNLIC